QIADVKFVAHEGTPLKHNNKSDGVPKAQQIFKRTAVARETDRSPNLCGTYPHPAYYAADMHNTSKHRLHLARPNPRQHWAGGPFCLCAPCQTGVWHATSENSWRDWDFPNIMFMRLAR
ncbi:MAG: hypothetical protein Q8Q98_04415, partial [Polaromonas sp.]|nr:hypothetical protein [Polaromonas sp.]